MWCSCTLYFSHDVVIAGAGDCQTARVEHVHKQVVLYLDVKSNLLCTIYGIKPHQERIT